MERIPIATLYCVALQNMLLSLVHRPGFRFGEVRMNDGEKVMSASVRKEDWDIYQLNGIVYVVDPRYSPKEAYEMCDEDAQFIPYEDRWILFAVYGIDERYFLTASSIDEMTIELINGFSHTENV